MRNWPMTDQAERHDGPEDLQMDQMAAAVPYVTARWEEELPALLHSLGVRAEGVVQAGAHTGQEVRALAKCRFRRLVMIEPNRDHAKLLREQMELHHASADLGAPASGHAPREIVQAAAGRERGQAVLYITDYDKQASMLPPLPPLNVARRVTIPVIPVRDVQQGCNVLVVDVQGAELDVLVGADLDGLQLAVVEGSTWPRYEGGATLRTIAAYMHARGWRAVAAWAHVRPHVVDVAWLSPAPDAALRAS